MLRRGADDAPAQRTGRALGLRKGLCRRSAWQHQRRQVRVAALLLCCMGGAVVKRVVGAAAQRHDGVELRRVLGVGADVVEHGQAPGLRHQVQRRRCHQRIERKRPACHPQRPAARTSLRLARQHAQGHERQHGAGHSAQGGPLDGLHQGVQPCHAGAVTQCRQQRQGPADQPQPQGQPGHGSARPRLCVAWGAWGTMCVWRVQRWGLHAKKGKKGKDWKGPAAKSKKQKAEGKRQGAEGQSLRDCRADRARSPCTGTVAQGHCCIQAGDARRSDTLRCTRPAAGRSSLQQVKSLTRNRSVRGCAVPACPGQRAW